MPKGKSSKANTAKLKTTVLKSKAVAVKFDSAALQSLATNHDDMTKMSTNWWKLSLGTRKEYKNIARNILMAPFLFTQIEHSEQWISWAIESNLLLKERSVYPVPYLNHVRLLNAELMEIVHGEIDSYLNKMDNDKPGLIIMNVNAAVVKCVTLPAIEVAIHHLQDSAWFCQIRSNLKKAVLDKLFQNYYFVISDKFYPYKLSVAILLTAWSYCEIIYASLQEKGRQPGSVSILNTFDPFSTIDFGSPAENNKKEATEYFSNQQYGNALMKYTEAIAEKPYNYVLLANRALCEIKMEDYSTALVDAWRSRILKPTFDKAHYHYATALHNLKRYDDAKSALESAIKICKDAPCLTMLLNKVNDAIEGKIKQADSPTKSTKKITSKEAKKAIKETMKLDKLLASRPDNPCADCYACMQEIIGDYKTALEEGSVFLLKDKFTLSVNKYREAACILANYPKISQHFFEPSFTYALGVAYSETKTDGDLEQAQRHFAQIAEDDKIFKPMALYRLALVEYKCNNFSNSTSFLELSSRSVSNLNNISPINWPVSSVVIPESKPRMLETMIRRLHVDCIHPPVPDATCRYTLCSMRRVFIYFNDSDFKGFYRVLCTEKCVLEFHTLCWRAFKTKIEIGERQRVHDKEFLGVQCTTPDCTGHFQLIKFFENPDGSLKTEMRWHQGNLAGDYGVIIGSTQRRKVNDVAKVTNKSPSDVNVINKVNGNNQNATKKKIKITVTNNTSITHDNTVNAHSTIEPNADKDNNKANGNILSVKDKPPIENVQIGMFTMGKENEDEEVTVNPTKSKKKKKKSKKSQSLGDFLGQPVLNNKVDDEPETEIVVNDDATSRTSGYDSRSDCDSLGDSITSSEALGWTAAHKQMTNETNARDNPLLREVECASNNDGSSVDIGDPLVESLFSLFEGMFEKRLVIPYQELLDFLNKNLENTHHNFIVSKGGLRHFLLQDPNLTFLGNDNSEVCMTKDASAVKESKKIRFNSDILTDGKDASMGNSNMPVSAYPQPLINHNIQLNPSASMSNAHQSIYDMDISGKDLSAMLSNPYFGGIDCEYENYDAEANVKSNNSTFPPGNKTKNFGCTSEFDLQKDIKMCNERNKKLGEEANRNEVQFERDMKKFKSKNAVLQSEKKAVIQRVQRRHVGCMTDYSDYYIVERQEYWYKEMMKMKHAQEAKFEKDKSNVILSNAKISSEKQALEESLQQEKQDAEAERKCLEDKIRELEKKVKSSDDVTKLKSDYESLRKKHEETTQKYEELSEVHEDLGRDYQYFETQSNNLSKTLLERATKAEMAYFNAKYDPIHQSFMQASSNAAQTELKLRGDPELTRNRALQQFLLDVAQYSTMLAATYNDFEERLNRQRSELLSGIPLEKLVPIPVNMPKAPSLMVPQPLMSMHQQNPYANGSIYKPDMQLHNADSVQSSLEIGNHLEQTLSRTNNTALHFNASRPIPGPSSDEVKYIPSGAVAKAVSKVPPPNPAFEKFINIVAVQYPNKSRDEILAAVQDFRKSRSNTLGGLSTQEIVKGTIKMLHSSPSLRKKKIPVNAEEKPEIKQRQPTSNKSTQQHNSAKPKKAKINGTPAPWAKTTAASSSGPSKFLTTSKKVVDENCAICLELMDDENLFIVLDCGHRFHKECINEWLIKKQTCPSCRKLTLPQDEYPQLM